jgi:hypothetical protein
MGRWVREGDSIIVRGTMADSIQPTTGKPVKLGPQFHERETGLDQLDSGKKYPTFGLYFRRYAPFDTFGANIIALGQRFEGDKRRAASTSLKATSRTYGCVMFNMYGIVYRMAGSSGTRFHPLLFREIVGMAKVSMTVVRSNLAGPGLFEFTASTAGSNPLVPKSPDIDTIIKARVDFGKPRVLRLDGEVFGDNFPNLEVFLVCYRSAHTALLIDGRTTGGRDTGPYTRLLGSHSGHSLGRFSVALALNETGELASNYTASPTTLPDYPALPINWAAARQRELSSRSGLP